MPVRCTSPCFDRRYGRRVVKPGERRRLTSDAGESVVRALARDKPLPPDILLGAARQVGVLDEPTLALLQRLHDAKVRVGALFEGSGPSLEEFADEFGKLSEAQQAAALKDAAGRTPAQVLEQAEAQPGPAGARPPAPAARTLDEIVRELEGKGFSRDDLRKFMGTRTRLSAALARRVARLLDHFTPGEVREFGEFLARHKVNLNENTLEQLLENVPRGKLQATIGELEEIRAGEEPPGAEWPEEELAEQEEVTIRHDKPPPVRGGPLPYAGLPVQEPPAGPLEGPPEERVEVPPGGPIEAPLPDVVETPGSRALRASLIARATEWNHPPAPMRTTSSRKRNSRRGWTGCATAWYTASTRPKTVSSLPVRGRLPTKS